MHNGEAENHENDDNVLLNVVVESTGAVQTHSVSCDSLKALCRFPAFQEKKDIHVLQVDEGIFRVFPVFVNFLRTGKYIDAADDKAPIYSTIPSVYCWLLGEQVQSPRFQDLAMDRIYYHHYQAVYLFAGVGLAINWKPISKDCMQYVAATSAKGTLLRQFLFDAVMATQMAIWGTDEKAGIGVVEEVEWEDEKGRNTASGMKGTGVYMNWTYLQDGSEYPIVLLSAP